MVQCSEFPLKAFSNEIVPASGLMTFERIQEKGQDASMRPHCGGFVPTSQDEHEISLSCLSVLLPLLLSLPPFLPFGQTNSPSLCLCPSLTNVKGRSSISVFESVKPVQKVATKLERARSETSRGEWRFVWAKTIEGQWISEATREVGSTTVWGHVYATRLDRFSLKQFTFRGYRGSKIYRSKLCDK